MKSLLLAVAVVAAGAARTVDATTMVSMSMEQLTAASSDIVLARVVDQRSEWNATHTQIETITTLEVSQTFKGSAAATLYVRQPGGRIGDLTVSVPGGANLRPQREYVLFLEPDTGSNYRVVGMMQGAYSIFHDADSHEDRVVLPAQLSQIQTQVDGGGNPSGTVPLAGFHKYVASIVNAGIQIPHGLNIPVSIASTESDGVGRMHVYGRTTAELYPNRTLVIPRGVEVEGNATLNSGNWTIHWDEMSIRGVHTVISATNVETDGSLRGRSEILNVR